LSSFRSYGRLATMTLVLEGTPSSGGPRCLRSRGAWGFLEVAPSASFSVVSAVFVVSVSGMTCPGTFVGVLSAGVAASPSTCSVASAPSAFLANVVSNCCKNVRLNSTYSTSATSSASATATASATTTGGSTAAILSGTLGTASSALSVSLRCASELDGDLAVEDGLSVQLSNGTLGLGGG
jgi:hypothetical protein